MNEWVKKIWIYIFNDALFNQEKERTFAIVTVWMELEVIMLSGISQGTTHII